VKIPNRLKIGGYTFRVKLTNDPKLDHGGGVYWKDKIITINDRYNEAEAILMHEILESILVEFNARYYTNDGTKDYRFLFTHSEFIQIAQQLWQVLKENKLLR